MKKLFVIAAAACVTFASCVKNEPVATVEQGDLIAFESPVLAPSVKAVAGEVGELSGDFKVWAYLTTGKTFSNSAPYILGAKVIATEEAIWNTDKAYYWLDKPLSFVGVYPYSVEATVGAKGVSITDYVVDGQTDLLVSEVAYDVVKDAATNGVEMVFNHALSALKFSYATSVPTTDATIKVKSIKLNTVLNKGTFTQLEEAIAEAEMQEDCWAPAAETGNYTIFTSEGTAVLTTATPTATAGMIDLIVLPQSLTNAVEVEVVYTVQTDDMVAPVEQTKAATLYVDANSKWISGFCYTYNLKIGLDKITFAVPAVTPWETGVVPEVDVE